MNYFIFLWISFVILVTEEKAITKWHVFGRILMKYVVEEKNNNRVIIVMIANWFGENLTIKTMWLFLCAYYLSLFLFLSHQITCSFFCSATEMRVYGFFLNKQREFFLLFFDGTVIQFLFIFVLASSSGILNHDAFADVAVEFSLHCRPESCWSLTRVHIETWYLR